MNSAGAARTQGGTANTERGSERRLKRILDVLVAGPALLVLSPLLAIMGLAIWLTSPGPILYRWRVVGKNGRPLRAYKFRTMVEGADEMRARLSDRNEATGPVFKMKTDPRVTPLGRCLRRFSLDELPQLWSVLKGDMSLVGPRPLLVSEWQQCNEWQRQRLSTQPGAVSLWHVSGQPRDFDAWVRLDLEYIRKWTFALDLTILAKACWYIVAGKNC